MKALFLGTLAASQAAPIIEFISPAAFAVDCVRASTTPS
jgi:hypothetical protein